VQLITGKVSLKTQSLQENSLIRKESRGRFRLASAYDAKGGSQFRAILQLLRQIYSSFQRPYGTSHGFAAEVLATKGYANAGLFGSL
jgi:hypothetical protein